MSRIKRVLARCHGHPKHLDMMWFHHEMLSLNPLIFPPVREPLSADRVEDYEDAREMYAESLALSGYEVVCASDGQEALELVSRTQFDLVILDIALPRVDGLSVIRALRASDATREIPIITVSASVGQGMHATIIATGADAALDKPCLPEELDAEVRRWLGRRSKATREPA